MLWIALSTTLILQGGVDPAGVRHAVNGIYSKEECETWKDRMTANSLDLEPPVYFSCIPMPEK